MHTLTEQVTQIDHVEEHVTRTNIMLVCGIQVYIIMGKLVQEVNKILLVHKDLHPKTAKEEAILGECDQKNKKI